MVFKNKVGLNILIFAFYVYEIKTFHVTLSKGFSKNQREKNMSYLRKLVGNQSVYKGGFSDPGITD